MIFKKLNLYTHDLKVTQSFYCELLGFDLLKSDSNSFTLACGQTEFTFSYSAEAFYYHYAINLPIQVFESAFHHFSNLVKFIPDPDTGQDIIEHKGWGAQAFYFMDPVGNIGEFISHKTLAVDSGPSFTKQSILGICEIGWPVASIDQTFKYLEHLGLTQFSGDLHRFCAAGDARGLFILVNEMEKKWFPTDIPAKNFPWVAEVEINGNLKSISSEQVSGS